MLTAFKATDTTVREPYWAKPQLVCGCAFELIANRAEEWTAKSFRASCVDGVREADRRVYWSLWLAFFFQGMSPGFWIPALTNILNAQHLERFVPIAFVVSPVCALISPMIAGALADEKIPANRLYAWSSVVSAITLAAAFYALQHAWNPWWFIGFIGLHSLAFGPSWGLIATISLANLRDGERRFPHVRLAATAGWALAGVMVSYVLASDSSPVAGYAAVAARLLAIACAFLLPLTPPLGKGGSWKSSLGLSGFVLFRQRDHAVFFTVTMLMSIPLVAFYTYCPEFLKVLGNQHPTASMAAGQVTELLTMLVLGVVMVRFRIKTVLLFALGLSTVRYALFAYAGMTQQLGWQMLGITINGACYTFYFITAQIFLDRRVDPGLRGQAQGLLALMAGGVGPLLGAWICGMLRKNLVQADGTGWAEFWWVLTGMVAICFVIFALFYRGITKTQQVYSSTG